MKYIVTAMITATYEVDETDYDEDEFPYPRNPIKSIQRIEEDTIAEDPTYLIDMEKVDVKVAVKKKVEDG